MPDYWLPRLAPDHPGGSRRDHFAHRRAPDPIAHAPERWYHLCGKNLIGDWVRRSFPEARVQVDHEAVDNGQVPDVLVVFSDVRRFAFEVPAPMASSTSGCSVTSRRSRPATVATHSAPTVAPDSRRGVPATRRW